MISLQTIFALDPLECQIESNRGVGTICDFREVVGFSKDTSKIIAHPTTSFGQIVKAHNVHSIRFDRSIFYQIPNVIFKEFGTGYQGVRTVNFKTGKLYSINNSSFQNARDLYYLEVFNTKIGDISTRAFEGATNLREISLRQSHVGKISVDAFAGLPNLKTLNLRGTQFEDLTFLENLPSSIKYVEV